MRWYYQSQCWKCTLTPTSNGQSGTHKWTQSGIFDRRLVSNIFSFSNNKLITFSNNTLITTGLLSNFFYQWTLSYNTNSGCYNCVNALWKCNEENPTAFARVRKWNHSTLTWSDGAVSRLWESTRPESTNLPAGTGKRRGRNSHSSLLLFQM